MHKIIKMGWKYKSQDEKLLKLLNDGWSIINTACTTDMIIYILKKHYQKL